MTEPYPWHFVGVPRLGAVIFSPKSVTALQRDDVNEAELRQGLIHGKDVRARTNPRVLGRSYRDVRLVIQTYVTEGTAAVCVDGYRVKP